MKKINKLTSIVLSFVLLFNASFVYAEDASPPVERRRFKFTNPDTYKIITCDDCDTAPLLPAKADPLDLLKKFDPEAARIFEDVAGIMNKTRLNFLEDEDLVKLQEAGLLKCSTRWILRDGVSEIFKENPDDDEYISWEDFYSGGATRNTWTYILESQAFERTIRVAPFFPRSPVPEVGEVPRSDSADRSKVWVDEPVCELSFDGVFSGDAVPSVGPRPAPPIVITYERDPTNHVDDDTVAPVIRGTLPSAYYSIEAFVESFSQDYIQNALEGRASSLENTKDFLVGLIPVVGSTIEIINAENELELAIGVSGVIGDLTLVGGLVAKACKLGKTAKCLAQIEAVADASTIVFTIGKVATGNGNALEAGISTLAVARIFSAAFLKKKYQAEIRNLAAKGDPSIGQLELDEIACNGKAKNCNATSAEASVSNRCDPSKLVSCSNYLDDLYRSRGVDTNDEFLAAAKEAQLAKPNWFPEDAKVHDELYRIDRDRSPAVIGEDRGIWGNPNKPDHDLAKHTDPRSPGSQKYNSWSQDPDKNLALLLEDDFFKPKTWRPTHYKDKSGKIISLPAEESINIWRYQQKGWNWEDIGEGAQNAIKDATSLLYERFQYRAKNKLGIRSTSVPAEDEVITGGMSVCEGLEGRSIFVEQPVVSKELGRPNSPYTLETAGELRIGDREEFKPIQ